MRFSTRWKWRVVKPVSCSIATHAPARNIAGDGPPVRLTDRNRDADGRGRPVGSDQGGHEPFDES
jgi:hypothetical protein